MLNLKCWGSRTWMPRNAAGYPWMSLEPPEVVAAASPCPDAWEPVTGQAVLVLVGDLGPEPIWKRGEINMVR